MRAALLLVVLVPLAGCFLLEGEAAEDAPAQECRVDADCAEGAPCIAGSCGEPVVTGGSGGGGGAPVPVCQREALDEVRDEAPAVAQVDVRFGYSMVALGGSGARRAVGAPGICITGVEPVPGRIWLVGDGLDEPVELPATIAAGVAQLGGALAVGRLDGRRVLVAATSRLRDPNGVSRDCTSPSDEGPLALVVWDEEALLSASGTGDLPEPACRILVPLTAHDAEARGTDPGGRPTWTLLLPGDLDGSGGEELVIGRPEAGSIVIANDLHGCTAQAKRDLAEVATGLPLEWPAAPTPSSGYGASLAVVGAEGARQLVVGSPNARRVELLTLSAGAIEAPAIELDPPRFGRFGEALAVSADGTTLAVSAPRASDVRADGAVTLFDVATRTARARVLPEGDVAASFGSTLLFAPVCGAGDSLVIAAARALVRSGQQSVEAGRLFAVPVGRLATGETTPRPEEELEGYGSVGRLGTSLAAIPGGLAAGAPSRTVGIGYAGAVRLYRAVAPQP